MTADPSEPSGSAQRAARDAYLDDVLIGGREPFRLELHEYDEAWPATYLRWRTAVVEALGSRARSCEHIGSTSVPGLIAKPIVDILLTVDDVDDESAYLPALESLGLVLRVREPHHRMLRTPDRGVHLHVLEPGRPEARDHIEFRDRLRADAADRQLYAETKRRLATRSWHDMNDYADAKTGVIAEILQHARR